MPDLFSSAKAVLRRADHHITDLDSIVQKFKTEKPYATVIEYDANFGKHLLKAKFIESRSEDASCIMFDAVNNLRSCLDQMTYAVASRYRSGSKWAGFPFASDLSTWPNRINGLKDDLPTEIKTLFATFQPYKGGNDTIWALNYIANTKKHALLVPVGFGPGVVLTFPGGTPPGMFLPVPRDLLRKDEIVICVVDKPEPVPQINLRPIIVIDDTEETIEGQQPVPLLESMRREVSNILSDTEYVCREIGLI